MIDKISQDVADYFFEKNLIRESEKDIYEYGVKLIASSVIGIFIVIFIGIVLGKVLDSIVFLLCFMILRKYSGGYHANSYLTCNLFFITVFLSTVVTVEFTPVKYRVISCVVMHVMSFAVLLKFSPIENYNKRLEEIQKLKNKKVSLTIYSIFATMTGLLILIDNNYYYNISVIVFAVTVLMIISILKEAKKHDKNNR